MEKLRIYKKSLDLVVQVYKLINSSPPLSKDYSLNDQIKRSAVSVLLNIAEGYCRSRKQYQNYLEISVGSSNETIALLQVIEKIYCINTISLQEEYSILGKQIYSFSRNLVSH